VTGAAWENAHTAAAMRGLRRAAERFAVRAELDDLGVPAANCQLGVAGSDLTRLRDVWQGPG